MSKIPPLAFGALILSSLCVNAADLSKEEPASQTPYSEPLDYYRFSIAPEVSSLGYGGTVGWRFSELVGVRAGCDYFGYSDTQTIKGIKVDATAQILSEPVTLDIYPWSRNSIHFSAGLLVNENTLFGSAQAVSNQSYTIDGTRYNAGQVGRLNIGIRQNPVAPYIGFGGNLFYFDSAHHWAMGGEVGVAYMGSAAVKIDRSGGVGDGTALGAEINHSIKDETGVVRGYGNDFGWWPVVKLMVSYSF